MEQREALVREHFCTAREVELENPMIDVFYYRGIRRAWGRVAKGIDYTLVGNAIGLRGNFQ